MVASHSSSSSTFSGMGLLHTPHVGFLGNSSGSNHRFSHGQGYSSSWSFSSGSNASNASYGRGKFSHNKFHGQHFQEVILVFHLVISHLLSQSVKFVANVVILMLIAIKGMLMAILSLQVMLLSAKFVASVGMVFWTVFTYPIMHIKGKDHLFSCQLWLHIPPTLQSKYELLTVVYHITWCLMFLVSVMQLIVIQLSKWQLVMGKVWQLTILAKLLFLLALNFLLFFMFLSSKLTCYQIISCARIIIASLALMLLFFVYMTKLTNQVLLRGKNNNGLYLILYVSSQGSSSF